MGGSALGSVVVGSASGPGSDYAHQGVVGRCEEALEVSTRRPTRLWSGVADVDGKESSEASRERRVYDRFGVVKGVRNDTNLAGVGTIGDQRRIHRVV